MKHSHFALLCCAFAYGNAFAIDRVVGPSGLYNTISGAIAASSDGDRILVEPANYAEDVLLGKSLSILCNQEGGRYRLSGSLTLVAPSSKEILLSGIRVMNGVFVSGTATSTGRFRMVDSYAFMCILPDPYLLVELYRDTIATSVIFSAGRFVGNTILGTANGGGGVQITGASQLNEESWVIGNTIGTEYVCFGVEIYNSDAVFHVENNFIRKSPGTVGMNITRSDQPSAIISSIINNTFYMPSGAPATCISNANVSYFNLLVKNNAMIGYNAVITTSSGWRQLVQSHNMLAAPSWINTITGAPSQGSPLINAGDPAPRYLDLDLTTNDVGCYGGSNSRANFTTPMGGAVVGFMQAPRVVSQGDAVNISATGFDR